MFFGNRAYGLQAASQIYYGKNIDQLSVAQYAMIVGVLKAPSAYNPLANLKRAMIRRDWILGRMFELKHIDQTTYEAAINEANSAEYHGTTLDLDAPYIAEMARQEVLTLFGDGAYTEGYKVYTSVDSRLQAAAQTAALKGLLDYDQRHGYRGPEQQLPPSQDPDLTDWQDLLQTIPILAGQTPAAVTHVAEKTVDLITANGELIHLNWEQGLSEIKPYINEDAVGTAYETATAFLKVGDLVRIQRYANNQWRFSQVPGAQTALVALDPSNGAIKALVGGLDFERSHYNRVTQSTRQPGSSFKPFLYTVALENGFTPATIINDAPIVIENTGNGVPWRPENDDGKFIGPLRLRQALYRSRNLISIRLLRSLGMQTVLDSLNRFGFKSTEFPRDLSLALGTHALTPLQMASAYASFANGGFKVDPFLVTRVENDKGNIVFEAKTKTVCSKTAAPTESEINSNDANACDPAPRIIDARIAYLIDSMMRDVIRRGTGRLALELERGDIAGKTGTTNGPRDTWFSGYNPSIVASVWVGFDENTLLGRKEYGSSSALPIWIDFMREALKDKLEQVTPQPEGLVTLRINPETGKPASPTDENAIFEVFAGEPAGEETNGPTMLDEEETAPIEEQATLPEELF
jgi:penicillin-binding protein 1A